jgi:hypothetical protein
MRILHVESVILGGISIFYPTYLVVSTGKSLCGKRLQYESALEHLHKRQLWQGNILSRDKIVPAERPAGCRISSDADLEVKRPSLVKESKIAVTFHRLHKVFGPHRNDRYNLDPDTDPKSMQGK